MEMAWIMGIFFIFCTFVFFALAFFFPEWVGITGNKAKDVLEHQQGDDSQKK